MIKKITLALMMCCIMISCGKKGNPEYKDPEKKAKMQTIIVSKA
jgi:hypothetical protein